MDRSNTMHRPNIVLCTCDQLRSFEVGCYGNDVINTPNIDKLAASGTRFETAISNCPSCTPARSSLLSGQYSRTCAGTLKNVPLNFEVEKDRKRFSGDTLSEVLKHQGYETVLCGKWHIHTHPKTLGFDRILKAPTEESRIDKIGEYIKENKDKPFFLYHNIISPHMPLLETVPEEYTTMYNPDDVVLRDNVWKRGKSGKKLPHDDVWFRVYLYKNFWSNYILNNREINMDSYPLPEGFDLRKLIALYYGSVTRLDNLIGQLMDILKQNTIADNTIVIFLSDHGDNLGSHQFFNKARLIEESIRIPMIWYYPGIINNQVNQRHIAGIIDIMPTILELIGFDQPDTVQGRSLVPVIAGEREELENNYGFIETPSGEIGIRTPRYLYGMEVSKKDRSLINEDYCFFDLKHDPYELDNLTQSDKIPEIAGNLRNTLRSWHENTPWLNNL